LISKVQTEWEFDLKESYWPDCGVIEMSWRN